MPGSNSVFREAISFLHQSPKGQAFISSLHTVTGAKLALTVIISSHKIDKNIQSNYFQVKAKDSTKVQSLREKKRMVASSLPPQWVHQELDGMQSPAFLLSGRVRRTEPPASGGQGLGEKEGLCADGTPAQVGVAMLLGCGPGCARKGLPYPWLTGGQLLWG